METTTLHSPEHGRLAPGGGRLQGAVVYLPKPVASCVHLYRVLADARLHPDTAKRPEAEMRARAEETIGDETRVPAVMRPYMRMALDHPVPGPGRWGGETSEAVTAAAWVLTQAMRARYDADHPAQPVAVEVTDRCRHGVLFADECANCGA